MIRRIYHSHIGWYGRIAKRCFPIGDGEVNVSITIHQEAPPSSNGKLIGTSFDLIVLRRICFTADNINYSKTVWAVPYQGVSIQFCTQRHA